MRRLFPIFARGAPAVGLLILRVAVAAALIVPAVAALAAGAPAAAAVLQVVAGVLGLLLLAGLGTPIAGVLVAIAAMWDAWTNPTDSRVALLLAAIAIALALLGPGMWSIDARLFGWKRFEIPHRPVH